MYVGIGIKKKRLQQKCTTHRKEYSIKKTHEKNNKINKQKADKRNRNMKNKRNTECVR